MADDPRYAPMPIVDDAELLRRQLLGDANQQMAEEAADATYARGDMSLAADLDVRPLPTAPAPPHARVRMRGPTAPLPLGGGGRPGRRARRS